MKLPLLLAEYLYQHKKLRLPGIGLFTMNPSAVIPDEGERKQNVFVPEVDFENEEVIAPDDELLEYIKKHTGKIRPLAIADLDSYLTLGTQMINIGKPFYMEGIGTLTKGKEHRFDFAPGKHDVAGIQSPESSAEQALVKKNSQFDPETEPRAAHANSGRKVLATIAIIGGLAIIAWGGYKLYEKNAIAQDSEVPATATQPDTTSNATSPQQLAVTKPADSPAAKTTAKISAARPKDDSLQYKFIILQTNDKSKALKRYNQLLSYSLQIKIQTRDSSSFKLYFTFPAAVKDTIRIKDSLNLTYATHTIIEPAMNN